jgi:hypothetical protein
MTGFGPSLEASLRRNSVDGRQRKPGPSARKGGDVSGCPRRDRNKDPRREVVLTCQPQGATWVGDEPRRGGLRRPTQVHPEDPTDGLAGSGQKEVGEDPGVRREVEVLLESIGRCRSEGQGDRGGFGVGRSVQENLEQPLGDVDRPILVRHDSRLRAREP